MSNFGDPPPEPATRGATPWWLSLERRSPEPAPLHPGPWWDALEHRSPDFVAVIAGLMVLVLGVLNALIDAEVTFSVFYLVPVAIVSWYLSRAAGLAYSVLCASIWFIARLQSGAFQDNALVESWDGVVRLGLFASVALLLSALRDAFDRERELARTDPITGVRNSRAFRESAQREIERARQLGQPYALACLDLDNFKQVNDRLGHTAGDRVLHAVSQALLASVRDSDIVARLGGDEFAILLPRTPPEVLPDLLSRLRAAVACVASEVDAPLTFSIGAMTCRGEERGVEEVLQAADQLMYRVKHAGKNGVAIAPYEHPRLAAV